jgi:hypothetical protein
MDGAWTKQHINISALADNQPAVQLRWSYRIIKTGASPMSGWNIDDVEILADSVAPVILPRLDIQFTPANELQLSWPTNSAGFVLQRNADLATTNWVDTTAPVSVLGTNSQVVLSPTSRGGFFRLVAR